MKPIEFVLWLNGAAGLVGDQPPTPEQWAIMREKLGEAVGGIVAARLLERAEEHAKADERRKKEEADKAEAMKQMLAQRGAMVGGLGQYQLKVDEYANQVEIAKQKMELAGQAMRAGGIMMIDPPERQPSMLSRLLGKATT
jgi:hypothetical protein